MPSAPNTTRATPTNYMAPRPGPAGTGPPREGSARRHPAGQFARGSEPRQRGEPGSRQVALQDDRRGRQSDGPRPGAEAGPFSWRNRPTSKRSSASRSPHNETIRPSEGLHDEHLQVREPLRTRRVRGHPAVQAARVKGRSDRSDLVRSPKGGCSKAGGTFLRGC